MNWYLQSGNESDVIFNSKISLARNINGYQFEMQNEKLIKDLENLIQEHIYNIGYNLKFLRLKDMDDITIKSLVEKGIINENFAKEKRNIGSILINDDENICIEINGENHLNIQVFNSGLQLKEAMQLAIEIDRKIGDNIEYAINKKYGYLTRCPYNLGTGLKACVKMYLPGLSKTKNIRKVLQVVSSFGIDTKPLNGEIFEISNQRTLGITEDEIVADLYVVAEKIILKEREARKILEENAIELEDKICRSYGILANCKKISSKEIVSLLADIKLGADLGILENLTDLKVLKLYIECMPGNLQKKCGNKLDRFQRDIERTKVIKEILES